MRVRDIMAKRVDTISADETIAAAAARMRDDYVGCLVVTEDGVVEGILTDRDLAVGCLAAVDDPRTCRVLAHMSSPAITVEPEVNVLDAAHLMREKQVRRLPVVEATKLVGVVSLSDVAQAMSAPLRDLLTGIGMDAPEWGE